MPDSSSKNLKLVIRKVLRSPLSVSMIALWLVMLLVHAKPETLFIGGVALISALVVYALVKLRDEQFIGAALGEARERQRREDLQNRTFRIEELDVESRVRMKAIIKLQDEIAQEISSSDVDAIASGLDGTLEKTSELTERALEMAQQRRDLQRYLSANDESGIQARIRSLEAKLASESDPARQLEVRTSLESKQKELKDFQAINQAAAHILDQLDSIECSFSELRARLVMIKSTNISDWVAANTQLQTELGSLSANVDTLQQSISEALQIGGAGTE